MSQGQAVHILQVLPHFLTSKSLFWCNFPLAILSEYPLDSTFLLYILLYPLPFICCFPFDFPLLCFFFFFFNYYHHFFFNYLMPPPPCSWFFFGFYWFFTFQILFLLFHLIYAFSLIFICFLFFIFFIYFFFDFLVVFYSLMLFHWISCCRWLLLFFLEISGWFMLFDWHFLLQCNVILNYFWLTFSEGCLNPTLWCHISQGTHSKGSFKKYICWKLPVFEPLPPCSFLVILHVPPLPVNVCFR